MAHKLCCVRQPRRVQGGNGVEEIAAELRSHLVFLVRGPEEAHEVFFADVLVHKLLKLLGQARALLLALALPLHGLGACEQHAHRAQRCLQRPRLGSRLRCLTQAATKERGCKLHALRRRRSILGVRQQRQQCQRKVLHQVLAARHLLHQVLLEERRRQQPRKPACHNLGRATALLLAFLKPALQALGLALGMLAGQAQQQLLVAHDLGHGEAAAVAHGREQVHECRAHNRRLVVQKVGHVGKHRVNCWMRERVLKDPAEALRHCCPDQWRLLVACALAHEHTHEIRNVSRRHHVPIVLQDHADSAAADPPHGLAWVPECLAQETQLLRELPLLLRNAELPRQQREGILHETCCVLADLPIRHLQVPPEQRPIQAAEQLVHGLVMVVAVELLQHGSCPIRILAGAVDREGTPVLNALLNLNLGPGLGRLPRLVEAHCIRLQHIVGPALCNLALHRLVHLGREARMHCVEEAQHVGAVVAPDKVGTPGAEQELPLERLDGLVLPVQLGDELPDLVEPSDVGTRGLRANALAEQEHEDTTVEILAAFEIIGAHPLQGTGNQRLRVPIAERQQ
mmetsp:Transcript_77445/g.219160  ORF Transcript_77445/g.219160 Transcript_77445/m.219160 type:complete len:570 (+) Transcript_77445:1885-3594(+)